MRPQQTMAVTVGIFLAFGCIGASAKEEKQSSVTQLSLGATRRCDLNNDGVCDKADVQVFDRLVGIDSFLDGKGMLRPLDSDGDGFVTVYDMRGLFPREEFPNEIAWLDLFEASRKLNECKETKMVHGMPWCTVDPTNLYAATVKMKEAVAFAERAFGPKDLEVARSTADLADLYDMQRFKSDAEANYRRTFEILKDVLGKDKAMDFAQRKFIWIYDGWVFSDPAACARAEAIIKEVVAWQETRRKQDDFTYMLLADVYYAKHDMAQAAIWYANAFKLWKDPERSPRAKEWLERYATALERSGKSTEAKAVRERINQLPRAE